MAEEELVRVQFYEPDVGYENLWASRTSRSDLYRIESVPFFVYGIALHDVVLAKPDDRGILTFLEVAERSGNNTLRARSDELVNNANLRARLTTVLTNSGCTVEEHRSRLFGINVPPEVPLKSVIDSLNSLGVSWEYGHPAELNDG